MNKYFFANVQPFRRKAPGILIAGIALFCHAASLGADSPSVTVLSPVQTPLPSPSRVCADSQGRLLVSDYRSGQVAVLDPFGRLLSIKMGLGRPLGIAVDRESRAYVAEETHGRVSVWGPNWAPLGFLGGGDGEFILPNHTAIVEREGVITVYVSDSKANVVKGYVNGALARTIGGDGQFDFPTGIAAGPAGELFVADQNNDQVDVFGPEGIYIRSFPLKPGTAVRSGKAQGMTTDAQGRLYVADSFQGYVKVFSVSDGSFLSQLGTFGTGPGQFRTPTSLAIDPWGRMFVASFNNSRVESFGIDCFMQMQASPASLTVGLGQTATFSLNPGCQGNSAAVQWFKGAEPLSDDARISGATNWQLAIAGITAADGGRYSARVSFETNVMVTPSANLEVLASPVITQNPGAFTAKQRGVAAFSVTATGAGLRYTWMYNGSPIPGATGSSLVLQNVQPSMRGNYSVMVSNLAGFAISAPALLTVIEAPYFTMHPQGTLVAEYGAFTLSAVAAGTAPVTWQWYRNGLPQPGRTTSSVTFTNVNPALAGNYYAVAANTAGLATSDVAVVTIGADTVAPKVLAASGGRSESRQIVVSFSEPVPPAALNLANFTLAGSPGLQISSAAISNSTNVVLTLSGMRVPGLNYQLTIRNVTDTALTPNLLNPNPTVLPVLMGIDLLTINGTAWKFLAPTNNAMDSQPWKTTAFNDASWSNGFGIFYGNRSNSVYQPLPNPNVRLPFSLSTSDPNNTRVYTVLNIFTNTGNAIRTSTYYFRTSFVFPAETNGSALLLHGMLDDGAVVYLNGIEVRRDRMPSGTPVFSTYASSSGSQAWSPALSVAGNSLPITSLRKGTNTVAIELHMRSATDEDATLGIWLEGVIPAYAVQPKPTLRVTTSAGSDGLVLSWDQVGWILDSAPSVTGPWLPLTTNSGYLVPASRLDSQPIEIFRLRRMQ